MNYIIDLDGTVICSKHRQATLPNGNLDLPHWKQNSTAELVALDSLLPCIDLMRTKFYSGNHTVIVCTARVLSDFDYSFFMENDIVYDVILSRPDGCTMPDAELKDIQLRLYAHEQGISWAKFASRAVILDDNQAVLNRLQSIGIMAVDAVQLNQEMRA